MAKLVRLFMLASLVLAVFALPAAAQEPLDEPYEAVAPIVVERPVVDEDEEEDVVEDDQIVREDDEDDDDVTVVAGEQLARTGLGLSVGMALALGLLLAGAVALFIASRRTPQRT